MGTACFRLTAELVSVTPIHVGSGARTGIIKRGLPYIPGSAIRGAVASAIARIVCRFDKPLEDHSKCEFARDCAYVDIFGDGSERSSKVLFRYAYPMHLKCRGLYLPVPRTTFVCENPQCKNVDTTFSPPSECKVCRLGKLRPARGFMCSGCGDISEVPISMGRLALTAVDRTLGSAASIPTASGERAGTLHVMDVIGVGSRFGLEVMVDDEISEHLGLLKDVLSEALPDEGIGGSKSRGLGKMRAESLEVKEVKTGDIEKRAEEIDASKFSVRLLSPMILGEDGALEAPTLLEAARRAYSWCFKEGKPSLPSVELVNRRFSFETYTGWSLKEERRRRVERAISAGSVFSFRSEGATPTLGLSLAALELYAIGTYKPHGCGQIKVEAWG